MTKKVLILAVLMIGLFQSQLFSLITSRIEGTVVDKDTGEPINGAKVLLFIEGRIITGSYTKLKSTETVFNGGFVFDRLKYHQYALIVYIEGYAPSVPLGALEEYLNASDFVHSYSLDGIDPIYLKEGEIKHFKIKLEKEAVLNVKVSKKTPSKTELSNDLIDISIINKTNNYEIDDVIEGTYRSKYLREGLYQVTLFPIGKPKKVYENVELKKGQTSEINYIMDFTSGTVLHGLIYDKNTMVGLPHTDIIVTRIEDNFTLKTTSDKDAKYWIGGLKPGTYTLKVHRTMFTRIEFQMQFKINLNEIKQLDIGMPGGYK